jgi:transcriptional regulator with XRE-family HTH domain
MDQQKVGSFLKELRKEKNLTQGTISRTVKCFRKNCITLGNCSNMPDISILVELAEFYDVSIPEIINGERKSENMNEEVKETALKLSDYAETINQKIKMRLFWLTITAIIGMIAFLIIEVLDLNTPQSIYEYIASAGLGMTFGMLIVIAMYLYGVLGKIKARRMMRRNARKSN